MRIITGSLKGRPIPVPGTNLLRPTSDRTKEGMFSVISARRYFDNTKVLDLFAGSGNLGFEAISRGATHCTFVDNEPRHIKHIESIAAKFDILSALKTYVMDIESFLQGSYGSFDFIFADPPYDYHDMSGMVEVILNNNWLKENGWFILEHDKRHNFRPHKHCVFSKPYGRTIVSIFTFDEDII